ncbi:MAG: hypothetical protein V3U65_11180 [Granulosicoccaceae bacterium]
MIFFSHLSNFLFNAASVVFFVGLISSTAFAQSALSPEELQAHIEKQQAALDAAIANRDKTQEALEAKRVEFEQQTAKQEAIQARMKALCEEQEEIKPGSMENCMAGKTTK